MKAILFIDKKCQSSVTAYVRVHYKDGSFRHYVQGRYGGAALTQSAYDEAKPYKADGWKRYWHSIGTQRLRVEVMPFDEISGLESKSVTKSEVAK